MAHCVALWLVELVSFMRSERGFWDGKDGSPTNIPEKTPEKNGWKKNGKNTLYKETWLWILFSSSAEAKLEHVEMLAQETVPGYVAALSAVGDAPVLDLYW